MDMKLIILDRDGVINRDLGTYVTHPDEFEFIEGAIAKYSRAKQFSIQGSPSTYNRSYWASRRRQYGETLQRKFVGMTVGMTILPTFRNVVVWCAKRAPVVHIHTLV